MLEQEVAVTIPGHPKTKGSMKCIGRVGTRAHVLIEDHKSAKPWLDALTGWCRRTLAGRPTAAGQPFGVEVTFTLDRPKNHYGTGRNRDRLKDDARHAQPVGHNTGDVDKLLRVVLDALQAAEIIPNDSAAVEVTARKAYMTPIGGVPTCADALGYPGVLIRLYPL